MSKINKQNNKKINKKHKRQYNTGSHGIPYIHST